MAAAVASNVGRTALKGCRNWPYTPAALTKVVNNCPPLTLSTEHEQPMGTWSSEQIKSAIKDHAMLTWAPGKARYSIPHLSHGKGVYLYDDKGKEYMDWTSQAVCCNLGYDLPQAVMDSVQRQMQTLPFAYGGLGIVEVRARLSKLISEILPGELTGVVFPSSGSEANEAAIMMARRHTGKFKVFNWYRSYHGGTTSSQQATGDNRRWYGGDTVPGFIKAFNPYPMYFDLGGVTEEEKCKITLTMLEEQVLNEGPDTIAMIQLESVVGGGGVIMPPKGYMQGVRAICDKYNIMMHCDEVMVGFGRTGKMFGFQNYEGVIPDIVTAAKGLTAAALPISMAVCKKEIMESFEDRALGWGSTYQAHPVAMSCAYETVKYLIKNDVVGHVQRLNPAFENAMRTVAENHPSIKQYRSVGLFGCWDVHMPDGSNPPQEKFMSYKKSYAENGLIGLVRPPHIHSAPPLIITEDEMLEGFDRNDKALYALDEALGF
jgi:adenosylmethionine-8-amino-7-oxononanoate aminotransferase